MPAVRAHELKAELGARVKVEVIANTSHALVPEAPVEVADAIARFVGGLPP